MWGFTRQQLIFLGVVGVIILIFALVFLGIIPGRQERIGRVTLTVWGVDDRSAWEDTIFQYRKLHSNVRLQYTQINPQNYEQELINALAADRGPDIFMFKNSWLPKHFDKVAPLPQEKMSPATFKSLFPKVAEQDFTAEDNIYALPLSVDTLALAYNRDIFDNRRVALPPETWDEFLATIPRLRVIDKSGSLVLSAASIGGSVKSVPNAPDILSLLMLQAGAVTVSEESGLARLEPDRQASEEPLSFYTQFSNRASPYYAWNDSFKPSIDSFAEGKTAMVFLYAHEIPEIKAKNPFLDFAIRPVPQFDKSQAVNTASYWGLAVYFKAKDPEAAWDFVVFATTDRDAAHNYGSFSGRPPALRFLISEYLNDANLGAFVSQALTARSFYQRDDVAARNILNRAIERVTTEGVSASEAVSQMSAELLNLEGR